MLQSLKTVSKEGSNVILESKSYSTPAFQYVAVSPNEAACDNTELVKKYQSQLTKCDTYTRAVLMPV